MEIIELSDKPQLLNEASKYFWSCWGSPSNFNFYFDCIRHSMDREKALPKFYIALQDEKIIGSYALLVNDLISRQDLMPWFACLYVNEEYRGKGIAGTLLEHGLKQAGLRGFSELYLSTDLTGFYEAKGWNYYGEGYGMSGGIDKIYSRKTFL